MYVVLCTTYTHVHVHIEGFQYQLPSVGVTRAYPNY